MGFIGNVIKEQYEICGYIYEFQCEHKKIHEYVKGLLGYQSCSEEQETHFKIVLKTDNYQEMNLGENCIWETKKVKVFTKDMHNFEAWIDADKICEMESLYYHLLSPIIKKTLCSSGLVYFHGACFEMGQRGLVFLGERNAGKSTLSILELLDGNKFLTDDCIFLDEDMVAKSLYRPIHIDPQMGEVLKISDRISPDDKYLSKEKEVNYYPQKYHKSQIVQQLEVDAIIFLHLSDNEESKVIPLTPEQVAERIGNYTEDYQLEKILAILSGVPAYSVTWGKRELKNIKNLHSMLVNIGCVKDYDVVVGE